jgi:phosphoenolpyruvate carboxykinase (ATP)
MSVVLSVPPGRLHRDLSVEKLADIACESGQCTRTRDGALVLRTGKFTGRAAQDRFVALDDETRLRVEWGARNQPILPSQVRALKTLLTQHLSRADVYPIDAHAGGAEGAPLSVFTTSPAHALFARHLFQTARLAATEH